MLRSAHQMCEANPSVWDWLTDTEGLAERLDQIEFNLREHRSSAIKRLIVITFMHAKYCLDTGVIGELVLLDHIKEKVIEAYGDDFERQMRITGQTLEERMSRLSGFRATIHLNFLESMFTAGMPQYQIDLLQDLRRQPYYATVHESYKYFSTGRSPMHTDIFFFKKPFELDTFRYFFKIAPEQVGVDSRAINILSHVPKRNRRRRIREQAAEYTQWAAEAYVQALEPTNRVFLGSSYVPKVKLERLKDKMEAVVLLAAGFTKGEILECYSGFNKRQLSALQAHITRGTYDDVLEY